jgi:predicted lipoprotein with Yx(FWY)xxD motif
MIRSRFAYLAGTIVVGLSVLTACGGGNSSSMGSQGSTSQSTPSAGPSAGAMGPVTLGTAQAASLGTIVNAGGRTVYAFDEDTASPSKSNCYGSCAALWSPVPAGPGKPQLTGVAASAVGTVTRTDGTKQLTLGGWPLYLFANDAKAGDTNGQAVDGIWWVVSPTGKKIMTQSSGDSGADNSGAGTGY